MRRQRGRIAGVQVNIKVPVIKVEMLDVKALMRPMSERLAGEIARPLDVVFTQPDEPRQTGREWRPCNIAVLAPPGIFLAAAAKLGQRGPGKTATRGRRSGR